MPDADPTTGDGAPALSASENFTQLRNVHRAARERVKELQRENADLRASVAGNAQLSQRLLHRAAVAQATGILSDPLDAILLVDDLARFMPAADGTLDVEGIRAAVEQLAKDKPYLCPGSARVGPLPGPGAQPPLSPGGGVDTMNRLIREASGRS